MVLLAVSTILSIFVCTVSISDCPSEYRKLSPNHSSCLSPNPDCSVISSGIEDRSEIVDDHNTDRSKVATGEEKRNRGLPTAANMMELIWDPELAYIAQNWAEQCKFDHDCPACRSTQKYTSVGQNIARISYRTGFLKKEKPNWKKVVELWYNEVVDFDKNIIPHFNPNNDGPQFLEFTQMTWAETRTVGCGYVSYKIGSSEEQFHVCNYGPGGNRKNEPVYKEGEPCSQCPENTCCGDTCESGKVYPGLCRATNSSLDTPQ